MKINTSYKDNNEKPIIVTDIKGTIVYLNLQATYKLKLKIGDDISSFIDANGIKKLTMYNERIEIVKTLNEEYNEAILHIFGEGINKRVTIMPKRNINSTEKSLKKSKDILSVANNVRLNKDVKSISLSDFCKNVRETVLSTNNYVNVYLNEESIHQNESHLQALVLCSISMLNEINPHKPVDLYIRQKNNAFEFKIIVRVSEKRAIMGAQDIEAIYPQSGIRIALIDNICNRNDIEYSMNITDESLRIVFKIPEINKFDGALRAGSINTSLWAEMYELLKPMEI